MKTKNNIMIAKSSLSWVWWIMSIILALGRLKQDSVFKDTQGFMPSLLETKIQINNNKKNSSKK
jgi:hypothetical protein